jgi:hypothetical protein
LCLLQLLMYLHDAEKTAVSSNKMGAGGLPKNQREVANKVPQFVGCAGRASCAAAGRARSQQRQCFLQQ